MHPKRNRTRAVLASARVMCAGLAVLVPLSTALAAGPAPAYRAEDHSAAPISSAVKEDQDPASSESVGALEAKTTAGHEQLAATPAPTGTDSSAEQSAAAAVAAEDSYIAGPDSAVSGSFVDVDAANFPDRAFRDYILSSMDGMTVLTQAHLRRVTDLHCPGRGISSLDGIRFFSRLSVLNADRNKLTNVNLSDNPYLISVSLQDNPELSSLDLSGLSFLSALNVCDTDLSELDLSSCTDLRELVFGLSPLASIDLSVNTELRTLTCYGGELSALDVSNLPELRSLTCSSAPIRSIDLSSNTALRSISLESLQLATLDASNSSDCRYLSAPHNTLISVHGSSDASYAEPNVGVQNPYTIAVSPTDGSFDLAEIDPKFAQGTVTGLSKGTLNGSTLSGIAPGDTVTYSYSDGGATVDAVLRVTTGNEWVVPLSIEGWTVGDTPHTPSAESRFGSPVFTYGRKGGTFTSSAPKTAGTWICRAEVPGTASYGPLRAEVSFEVTSTASEIKIPDDLTAVYREPVGTVALPAGFTWVNASALVGNVGRQMHAAHYQKNATSPVVTVQIPIIVTPRLGSTCHISPVTNEYQAKHITITSGTYMLKEGTDYTLSYTVDGNTATITVHFEGNFTGTETRSFHFTHTNSWIVRPSIANWTAGNKAPAPEGAAEYGTVVFSYLVDGVYQTSPPDTPGTYTMRASVAATDAYSGLTEDVQFRVYRGIAPDVSTLSAVYGDELSSVALPEGFAWLRPDQAVGNVGVRSFRAVYTPYGSGTEFEGGAVSVLVRVTPKNGSACWISPITDEYESKHIVIRDGNTTLLKGTDYFVSHSQNGNTVTVQIHFVGNYTGTVTRTFTYLMDNEWIVPPSISGWVAGSTPSTPVGAAKYGTVSFTYETSSGSPLETVPTKAGKYLLTAIVPASNTYNALEASVPFTVYKAVAPDVSGLTAVYGDTLSDVRLPAGFTWADPDASVEDAGVHSFAAVYTPVATAKGTYMGGSVELSVRVDPKNGELLDISPVTNESNARHIVIKDGDKTLVKGTDYRVFTRIEGNTVTVTINFEGNYCGTVVRSFTFGTTNEWTQELSIKDWCMGQTPSQPEAEAKYGKVTFTYVVNGHEQSIPPTSPGSYIVRATVPASVWYPEITASVPFRIYLAVAPDAGALTAVYMDTLSDIKLPDGFVWQNASESCGAAGTHIFAATYTPSDNNTLYMGGTVQLTVRVDPRDGALCTISPITNSYESRHIAITDNGEMLVKGRDYTISSAVDGAQVTVTIRFMGNYYGTVERTFTLHGTNEWIEPVAMSSWIYGQSPSLPRAQAKYGTPSFTYLVDGTWQSERPRLPGTYTVRAVVSATAYYNEISSEATFTIESPDIPEPGIIQAVYGDTLSGLSLPEGFAWERPETSVGDVGLHHFDAKYALSGLTEEITVPVTVRVLPKNGADFTVSPVANMSDVEHITVMEDGKTLVENKDYTVSVEVQNGDVTVTIAFIGNYTGTIKRSFPETEASEAPDSSPVPGPSAQTTASARPTQTPSARPSQTVQPAQTPLPESSAALEESAPASSSASADQSSVPSQSTKPVESTAPRPTIVLPSATESGTGASSTPATASSTAAPSALPIVTATAAPAASATDTIALPSATYPSITSAPVPQTEPRIVPRPEAKLEIVNDAGTDTLIGDGLVATRAGTSVQDALGLLMVEGADNDDADEFHLVVLDDRNVVMKPDSVVTTDSRVQLVRVADGATVDEAVVVVLYDSLNIGRMNLSQLVRMAEAFTGKLELTGPDLMAAALGDGDSVTLTDIVRGAALYRIEIMDAGAD